MNLLKNVQQLTGSDFKDSRPWELKSKKCTFVLFYADWCGWCNRFKPDYNKFAGKMKKTGNVDVAAVNIDTQKALLTRMNKSAIPRKISSYPTVVMYRDGKFFGVYRGERTVSALCKTASTFCKLKK